MGVPQYVGYNRREELKEKDNVQRVLKDKEIAVEQLSPAKSSGSVEHIENAIAAPTAKPTKKQKLRRHLARFWCCYFIAGIIGLAIFLPIFFLIIIPAIAQLMVKKADLPISFVRIMNPTENTVTLSLNASLKVPPPFKVYLEPLTLQLYRPETKPNIIPYVNYHLPEQWIKGNTTISVVNQTVEIADKKEFTEMLRGAVYSKTFIMAARGETTAHLGAIKAKVTLDKEIELNGLDQLSGFDIKSASLLLTPDEDGSNLLADVMIPNHSIVNFELGNQTLNLNGPDNLILGNATIQNVYVATGNNTYSARGYVDISTTLKNLQSIISYTAPALAKGNLMLGASGNKTVFKGHHVEYYEAILNDLHLTGEVPILSLLADSFAHLMSGGIGGIRNLTEQLGINLTEILGILNGNGIDLGALEEVLGQRSVDLRPFMDLARLV